MYREQKRFGHDPAMVRRTTEGTWRQVNKFKPGERIFVCSWSDFFHPAADEWRPDAWNIIASRPDLIWLLLTKRPENIRDRLPKDWGAGWPNVWGGFTAENQEQFERRIHYFTPRLFYVQFVSAEPLLGPLDPGDIEYHSKYIDWIITGGESDGRPTHPDWIRSARDQCQALRIPFFFKQWGEYVESTPSDIESANSHLITDDGTAFYRIGKKKAGRLLDGIEHNEYPGT
jgi:protein gp37